MDLAPPDRASKTLTPGPVAQPRLLRAIAGETLDRPPVWFMRQAGRTLPEYRALRAKAEGFISFAMNPEMAAEATLQPLRRMPLDAAIIFADILLIPMPLGQAVWFEAGEGPRLGPLPDLATMEAGLDKVEAAMDPVAQTLRRVRAALASEPERATIGFAGGPWTVATYMIEGRGSDRADARAFAYADPRMEGLLEVLTEATVRYLAMQAAAGAQVLKIFESWAENLPEDLFARLVTAPHRRIVERLRDRGVDVPIIGFPRGAGALVENYAAETPVDVVALDTQAPAALGRRLQKAGKAIQGALDPLLVKVGGEALDIRIDELIGQWGGGRYIFNLGHGLIPDTPVEHIEQAVRRVTGR